MTRPHELPVGARVEVQTPRSGSLRGRGFVGTVEAHEGHGPKWAFDEGAPRYRIRLDRPMRLGGVDRFEGVWSERSLRRIEAFA